MPIIKSAIKRARQAVVRRERNVGIKKDIKGATKTFLAKPTSESLAAAHSELDKAVKIGLLKKNTVARRKSALAKIAKNSVVKLAPAKKVAPKTAAKPAAKAPAKKAPAKKPATKATAAKKPATKK
jgi:ribosomal protein S20